MDAPTKRAVRGRRDYDALPERRQEARARALSAVSRMRGEGLSLATAAAVSGTTPATVRRYAGSALSREHGRYTATSADRLYRRMSVLGPDGRTAVDTRGSRAASSIAAHWNAIDRYLATGDTTALAKFKNKTVGGVPFVTDPVAIERYYARGELAIDDIYAHR